MIMLKDKTTPSTSMADFPQSHHPRPII